MTCLSWCRAWTAEDDAADADEIEVEAKRGGAVGGMHDDIVIEVNEVVEPQNTPAASEDAAEVAEEEIDAFPEVPPTAEDLASAVDVEEASKEVSKESKEAAPSSGDSSVLDTQKSDAVKRVESELMEGGLLMTQVMGGRKSIRKLEVEGDSGVLKWEVEALFGMRWEQIKLSQARVMCTGNLVKIGVAGRREFLSFEACDDNEAAAVCDALVDQAKQHKTKDL